MKKIFFLVIFINSVLSFFAQTPTNYIVQGDNELSNGNYDMARYWYSQAVIISCDKYSIQKLVDIWKQQSDMKEIMQRDIRRCFNCVKNYAEAGDTEMMSFYSSLYKDGIGTEKDSISADYWYREYGKKLGFIKDDNQNIIEKKTPRKSLLSNRFYSFITYTFSPTMPVGLTAGVYFDKIGGYLSYRTDLKSINAAYECNNSHVPAIEIENPIYEFNRESWHSQMFTAGILYPVNKNRLFVSAGGGYGKRNYYREIISKEPFQTGNKSEWCFNTEASYKGLTLEAGGMFVWNKITVVGGVNSTKFKDLDVYFGIGITF